MTYFMSPAPNHWRRHPRGPRPRKLQPRGPNPKPNASQPDFPPIFASCEMLRHDILGRYILSRPQFSRMCAKSLSDLRLHVRGPPVHCSPRWTPTYPRPRPGGAAMSVQVTPHPSWVAELDSTLEPSRQAILDTPVIIDASENQLVDGQIQN